MDNIVGQKTGFTIATNIAVVVMVLIWLVPTVGLFISSFRERDQISESGWWKAPLPIEQTYAGRTQGPAQPDGDRWVLTGNILQSPRMQENMGVPAEEVEVVAFSTSAFQPGQHPAGEVAELGDGETLIVNPDGSYEYRLPEDPGGGGERIYITAKVPPQFTLQNYETVLTADDMDRAFINTLTVSIPATVIPILVAAFAAYALAWMTFPGRSMLVAAVVGLLVVPLQLALVPMLNFHNTIGIGQSFLGIWFAHTAFGMPLAVYLLRNYMVGLPRDIIESAKVDGATDFEVFTRIVLPLSLPALAAFSIFQFLWTWNDLLVAKVFLPSQSESQVMTVKIADDLLGSRGGDWGILATAAFVSIAVPLVVFFSMQRFLVRGLLAGSVK